MRNRRHGRFVVENLESRTLLTGTGVQETTVYIGSPLQPTEYGDTGISVDTSQTITIDVKVVEYGAGQVGVAPTSPAPTGTVFVTDQTLEDVSLEIPLTPVANGDGEGRAESVGSALLTMPRLTATGDSLVATYEGDDNYAEQYSIPPFQGGSFVPFSEDIHTVSFVQQPSNAGLGSVIAPPVKVGVFNAEGSLEAAATDPVTLTLRGGTGTLGGTVTENAVNGVATFSDLTVSASGTYTLRPSDPLANGTDSASFNVGGAQLAFNVAPSNGTAKKAIKPIVSVKIEKADGSTKTDDSSTVITLATIGFTGDAPITGNTATVVNGIATFPDLTFTTPGFYTLQATDNSGDAEVTSAQFKIVGDHLEVKKQPPGTNDSGAAVPFTVELLDGNDKLDKDATTSATLSLNVVEPGNNAVLSGVVAAAFVGGIATFSKTNGPSIDAAGTYTFTVTEANQELSTGAYVPTNTSTAVTTDPFKISGAHLAIKGNIAKTDIGAPIGFTVEYENAQNKVVTTQNGAGVSLTLQAVADNNPGNPAAVLGGITTGNFVNGVAKFTVVAGPNVNLPGDYTITAADSASPAVAVDVSNTFTVVGYHLAFKKQPTNVNVNDPIPVTVQLLDSKNKVVSNETTATVTLDYTTLKGGVNAKQTGTLVKTLVNGVATFSAASAPAFDTAGQYQFTATETGSPTVGTVDSTQTGQSKPVTVDGDKLVFLDPPKNTNVGDLNLITVALQHKNGSRVVDQNTDSIALTLTPIVDGQNATLNNSAKNFGPLVLSFGAAQFKSTLITAPGTFTITATQIDAGTGEASKQSIPVTSKQFKVTGLHVEVQTQPDATVDPYEPIPMKFALVNAKNKVDTDAVGYFVSYTLTATRDGVGASTYNGIDEFPFTDGVADLTNMAVGISDNPGTFYFDVQASTSVSDAAKVEGAKTKPFKVLPLHLQIQQQPGNVAQFQVLSAKVALVDSAGNVDKFDSYSGVSLTLTGGNGTLQNVANPTFVNGVADLSTGSGNGGVGIDGQGAYTLTIGATDLGGSPAAPDANVTPVATNSFSVTALTVKFITPPANISAGGALSLNVGLFDASGVAVTKLCSSLTFALQLQAESAGATGTFTNANPFILLNANGTVLQQPYGSISSAGTYELTLVPDKTVLSSITSDPFTVT